MLQLSLTSRAAELRLNKIVNQFDLPQDKQDSILINGIWTAAIIQYCRCFTSGERKGLTDNIFAQMSDGAEEFHEYVKAMRDKFFAYSVNPFEGCETIVVFNDDNSLKDFGVGYGNVAKLQSTKEGLGNLSKLYKDLRNIIKTKCDEISIQLKEEIKKLSPEEINKLTVQESCKTNSLSLEYHFSKFLLLHM